MKEQKNGTSTEIEKISEKDIVLKKGEICAKLDGMEEGIQITTSYYEFEIGEEVRCWYVGPTVMKGQDGKEDIEAAKLLLRNEEMVTCASTMLVSNLKELQPLTPVLIIKTGESKSTRGTYHTFKIIKLM